MRSRRPHWRTSIQCRSESLVRVCSSRRRTTPAVQSGLLPLKQRANLENAIKSRFVQIVQILLFALATATSTRGLPVLQLRVLNRLHQSCGRHLSFLTNNLGQYLGNQRVVQADEAATCFRNQANNPSLSYAARSATQPELRTTAEYASPRFRPECR